MRVIKTATMLVFASVIFGSGGPSCKEAARQEPTVKAARSGSITGSNDLSAYYGFREMEIIKLDWRIKDLRIADFSGDGRNDIAVVNDIKAKIELLIQKETIGPGEPAVAVDPEDVDINEIIAPSRFEQQAVAVSQRIFSLVCGDLNSDGMVDLAFYGEPKGLYVILQEAGAAEAKKPRTLSWRKRKKIEIDDGLASSEALVCADLNNDGADDLALASPDGVYVVLQRKDGTLAEPVKYASAAQILGVEVGDLNGDGINDLILVTNESEKRLHVRFGIQTGQLGPQVKFLMERPWAFGLYNLDGVVGDEILIVDAVSNRVVCYKIGIEKDKGADWPILFYPLTSGEGSRNRDLAVGDLDGDGLSDVVISDPGAAELIVYKQMGGVGLVEAVQFPAFADISCLSAADIDNDGKVEIAVLSIKEKVIGLSEFENDRLSFPKPIDSAGEPVAMDLADVDGDGSTDCVYISRDANDVRTFRVIYNSYRAGKEESNLVELLASWKEMCEGGPALELAKLSSNPDGLKVLDVDQDGLQDALILAKYEPAILVRQTQAGRFEIVDSPRAQAGLIKDASLSSIGVADVDGQGGKELLLAQENFARSLVFANGKNWSIIDQYNAKSTENRISAVAAFHIDGVGLQDRAAILLLDGQKGRLQILEAGDDKTYRFEKEMDVGKWSATTHLKILYAGLTGGTGKSMLLFDSEKFSLVTPPSAESVPCYLEQQFGYETKIKDGAYGNLTAGDINSDERADIVAVEYKHNHIEILALDSKVKPVPAMRFKVFEEKSYRKGTSGLGKLGVEPRELKVADVTGDDKDDLVTIIHDRVIIYAQD